MPPYPSLQNAANDSNSSTEIFHRAFANHRPEMGESSAESVARDEAIQSRIIHAGTGIPELTIDQLTNQKIQNYHRRATDIIRERKNDK